MVWAAFFSPLLQVDRIRVSGARHTSAEEIARVAGLDSSDNLLLVSTSSIAAEAGRLPWVKTAQVERKLPGTVKVTVSERRPSLILPAGGRRWLVDKDGRVLSEARGSHDLPVIAGMSAARVEPGATVKSEEIKGALAVLRSLPPDLRARVDAFFVPTVERLSFSLHDGPEVRYGPPRERASKNEVLKVLLRRLGRDRSAAYVDVRIPTSPAVSTAAVGPPAQADAPVPAPTPAPTPTAPSTP
jgi:cell division protein FtsQ